MISSNYIKKVAISSYPFLSKCVPIISGISSEKLLYNRSISNNWRNLNENSCEGRLDCGAYCYLLHFILQESGIKTKNDVQISRVW